jgi:hypothetical protein
MIGLALTLGALLLVMTASELALRGTKLQTGLGRILVVWTLVYLAVAYPLWRFGEVRLVALTVFWGGAFLSWFGVRSHIESSILLRMLHILRRGSRAESALISEYLTHAGHAVRTEELVRGNLAERTAGGLIVTKKGRGILGVVEKLR